MSGRLVHHLVGGVEEGPTLVLGNSLGADTRMWDEVAEILADQFRIVRYDHRGQGKSPPAPLGPIAIEDHGEDVLDLLDELGVACAAYAGISFGGMVGLWLAAHAPERIAGLSAICTSAHPGGTLAWEARARTVLEAGGTAPIVDAVTARWFGPGFLSSHPEVGERMREILLESPPEGYAACCRLLALLDLRPYLGEIRCPVQVIAGSEDEALPPAHGEAIAAAIPQARYSVLDGAGHVPSVQFPELVAEMIRYRAAADLA